ncbi:hypothetical protein SAMN04515671_1366 [Nakamurella panacisegetis]|uniref:Uncharacterized protein n=1 Tax=Nakamurella panacisegetis TaxID=1090615 RepID=A0A1H0KMB8_9ACTN|nr:hypothetical protein [Nakamurella panacisegetis]SDO57015.1 hypothetical protein SAMN04515671_1366 [Nakamurella panacisegetis]
MITPTAAADKPFFDGFGWSQASTIIAGLVAATVAVIGYTIQRKIARRNERATLYGNAIGTVEAYLEGPYRIRRKTDDPNNWLMLSSALSDIKTSISHHQALLEMHAPVEVVAAFTNFAAAAIREAGPQMTTAWAAPTASTAAAIPLGTRYSRTDSDSTRTELVRIMAADLKAISTWWHLTS